jgi:Multicopper oxidase
MTIATKPLEVAPNRILSVTTYNGQFPGPLLRFKEGHQVTIDVHNQTDTPEQLHWHGQFVSTEVDVSVLERSDGAAEGAPHTSPPWQSQDFLYPRIPRVSVSITPTFVLGLTFLQVNTAGSSALSTSSPRTIRATTTAKCSSP